LIAAVNCLVKLRKLTRTPPITRRMLPVTREEKHILKTLTRRLMEVIRYTPVRNAA
jgi:hypothetical protein